MANEVTLCRLTAKKIGVSADDLSRPQIFNINAGSIKNLRRNFGGGGSVFEKGWKVNGQSSVHVYETPSQIRANINLTAGITDGLYDAGESTLNVAAAGSTLAAARQLTAYFNQVATATATSADGVKLYASPAVNDTMVVLNATAVAVDVFPGASGAKIDALATGAQLTCPAGKSIHFVCKVGGATAVWQSAIDENNA